MTDPNIRLELQVKLQRIQRELDDTLRALERADGTDGHAPTPTSPSMSRRAVRDVVLESLDDLRWPAHGREISLYAAARYGRTIPPARYGSLAADEREAYFRGRSRPVWLCNAITHDRGQAIRRLWARSDWPLTQRVVAPTTGRVQHLRLSARVAELAATFEDEPGRLHFLAADLARDLPDTDVRRGVFALDEWRATAQEALSLVEADDAARRNEAAKRLGALLSDAHQLFGAPDVLEGVDELPPAGRAVR